MKDGGSECRAFIIADSYLAGRIQRRLTESVSVKRATGSEPKSFGTVATEIAFGPEKMRELYGTPERYVEQFSRRLDALIAEGWFLAEDAADMLAEAQSQQW